MPRPCVNERDTGFREFLRWLTKLSSRPAVKVGFLADKHEQRQDSAETNVAVAAANEFGTRTIPARPFIASTFAAHRAEYEALGAKLTKASAEGRLTVTAALGLIGAKAAADIKETVTQGAGVQPPNDPETIKRKGHDRPLVGGSVKENYGGGQMIGAVTWAIEGAGK